MGKVFMAIDDSAGSKAALKVYRNQRQRPAYVVLVHVVHSNGMSMMSDMNDQRYTGAHERATDRLVRSFKQEIEMTGPVSVRVWYETVFPRKRS